ncbi:putative outer membrane starch-binding protein [Mucilaginibacter gracilis]|uniref:Putative outer membrane starch-binding protein n=1 Tax=Mucilaginibacter gracilis TaxID=423350 RepID=A0A495J3X6_9SPHI|nr:RagB/SusD family nutrient uptake outer membrane protein [Mucilaginibacter gracilis]RKR83686.1 putative outer membrane starch-binding protein [Mucilaginibacter gracilis]
MKKYIAMLMFLVVTGTSCKKDFIELSDPTKISVDDLYSDANGLGLAVTAAYGALQDIYGKGTSGTGMYLFTDVPSDNSNALVSGAGLGDFDLFTVAPENVNLSTQWQNLYRCIARCNAIIGRAPGISMSATLRDRYIAEAKFLRALSYFNAVRIWGGIPLVTKEIASIDESLGYGRETVDNVYAQIEKDLSDAETVLPATYAAADLGRATSGAAKAILGKVYLTEKKFQQCKSKLAELLPKATNAWGYDLLPLYSDVFNTANEMNKEIIFAVRYTKGGLGTGSPFFNWFVPNQSGSTIATVGGGSGFNTIMQDLYDAFPTNDLRRGYSIANYVTSANVTYYYTKKYTDVPANANDSNNDWIVIRYADVLLMYAEADNEINNGPSTTAIDAVNQVRRRGYGHFVNGETLGSVTVVNGGASYTSAPTVAISGGGATSNATATATISGGKVTAINIVTAGQNYTSNPTVTITGGGGTGATATAIITKITDNDVTAAQTASHDAFKLALETERRLELNMEGHRWFDLLRTDRAVDVMNASFNKYQTKNGTVVIQISAPHALLFPIPLREIQINPKLTQNP